jgi:hypothetical protein
MQKPTNKKCRYYQNKMKYFTLIAMCVAMSACSTTSQTPTSQTPAQTQQDIAAAQQVLKAGLQDYKTIKAVTK